MVFANLLGHEKIKMKYKIFKSLFGKDRPQKQRITPAQSGRRK
jgi:hypothetical protein